MFKKPWTKEDRAPYNRYKSSADNIEDYLEDLVDDWHTSPEDIPLHLFLGMDWDEYKDWTASGRVSDRISQMWNAGQY